MQQPNMFDILTSSLGGTTTGAMAGRLGADESSVQKGVSMTLPVLISALARNASTREGAASLSGALARDHDGSVLDDLAGYVTGGDTATGDAILKHVLGAKRGQAETGISQASGLDPQMVSQLLAMLAPLVLGYLGKQQRGGQLSPGDLGDLLAKEETNVKATGGDVLGDLLGGLLGGGTGGKSTGTSGLGMSILRQLLGGGRRR